MPPTSSAFTAQIYGEVRRAVAVYLITVEHPDAADTIRLCTNTNQVTSRGDVFNPAPGVEVGLYEDREDRPPRAKITLENVTSRGLSLLRQVNTPPAVKIELVTLDEPDTVQADWTDAVITEAPYDAVVLEVELAADRIDGIGAPGLSFTPGLFPAMHAGVP